jgi:hypothetical protein
MICPNCKKQYIPKLGARLHPELLIQQEFPNAESWEREQLVSGICSNKCWDEFLGVPIEDDNLDEEGAF